MVLVAVDDLMFSSRISTAAKAVGAAIRFTRSPDAVVAAARETIPALVLLDLNSARTRPLEIIAALKSDAALAAVPTVGFVSHVDTGTIAAARRAGVDRVLARSAFVEQLPALLAGKGLPPTAADVS
jgi:PleD family two-component response regulator